MYRVLTSVLIFAFIMVFSSVAWAQTEPDSTETARQQQEMEEYMKMAQPGPEHDFLAKLVGDWEMETKFQMKDGDEPMTSKGTAHAKMILGNRFLEMESESGQGMMEMESLWLIGFDNRHKEFITVGFDNMGTYFITASGAYDENSSTMTLSGTDIDPVGGFTQVYDFVYKFEDDDNYSIAIIFKNKELTGGADSFKMAEIFYKRAQ